MAALSEPALTRQQKSIAEKNIMTRPASGALAKRKATLLAPSASAENAELTAAPVAVAHTARIGCTFDIDPATLSYYISVVGRYGADRSQRALYFDMT